ncbi:Ada metal-binding domain-containing protein [Sphingomonas yabuuchiae]|uniref:AraC family transcriptional regulator of adaptative response/methylated-DNA-[protein]-cysteine methyltransferase n=1 Tax=Sphingomonas yabuuchiae TaxID=172044 RepID=A0AA41A0N2_9SPHN|nr:AraC family transcriptional regulator of adaptative response/methylated-DNA-[protein]-cysteine methyltransferase [Sphingomonas yabuuchiae]MBN3559908.1 helix-turn-helix domain-containing protein [Sphingomonas yabuuchiae]
MTDTPPAAARDAIDEDAAWAAFAARDRSSDGRFVVAVKTTGIYCRPSCAARRPRREHVRFLDNPQAARAEGFRACLRCLPDTVARDRQAVAAAIALIEAADAPPSLETLAAQVGYAPHHFHRLFKRATGVTPAAYARARRSARAAQALAAEPSITAALYEAGYAAPSRFYADSDQRLGMAPGQWRRGGEGVSVGWTIAPSPMGPLLVATTDRGIARIAFEEDEQALVRSLPAADIRPADEPRRDQITRIVTATDIPDPQLAEPARRTAFIEAVSRALLGA